MDYYGYDPSEYGRYFGGKYEAKELLYHTSWDWLMPVWEKIMTLDKHGNKRYKKGQVYFYRCEIGKSGIYLDCSIWLGKPIFWKHAIFYHSCYPSSNGKESKNMFEVYYKTMVEFIKWYNETKNMENS